MHGTGSRKGKSLSTGIKKKRAGICFILPGFLGVFLFSILPFFDVVRRAFSNTSGTTFAGFRNFATVLQNEAFLLSAKNTARFILTSVPLLLFLSLLMACYINARIVHKGIVKAVILFPMVIPVSTTTLFCRLLFDDAGMMNGTIRAFGGDPIRWMDSGYVFWVLVLLYIWKNIGFCVILWCAAMDAIPKEIYETAKLDGAGFFTRMGRIILPILSASAFIIVLLLVLNSFKVFRESYMLTGNYPHRSIYMTQNVFNNWFQSFSVEKMAAGAVIVALVLAAFVMMLQKRLMMRLDER
ncbi:sugar ABC transporter permease [Sellimonas caecigallum]|uniref:Sugar ABC transporter permease n=1 Tax=Sellimonas caecigallum TaxID=2592333 RepID=A0ABS7L9I4_9FIRM|nr:sugar ABC transporter permease [Sellimonas caecigallum]